MDFVLPFQLDRSLVRGRLVRLKSTAANIIDRHDYPETVHKYLLDMMALSSALSSFFKYEGVFTLQASGEGPLRLVVVDVNSQGHLRACARFDAEALDARLSAESHQTISLPKIFGKGHLAFTIDQQQSDDRYQGIVALEGATLTDCLHQFFRQSEQVDTGVVVFSNTQNRYTNDYLSGALILQKLPLSPELSLEEVDEKADQWLHALSVLGTLTEGELLSQTLSANDLLYRLFWAEDVRTFDQRPIVAQCRCSVKRVFDLLKTFSDVDIQNMIHDNQIEVICEFCSHVYQFDPEELNTST